MINWKRYLIIRKDFVCLVSSLWRVVLLGKVLVGNRVCAIVRFALWSLW